MKFVIACVTSALILTTCANAAKSDAIRLADGKPLIGVYFFTHWWEPWRSSDDKIVDDLNKLKDRGFNTIFLDSEWSQMIDGNWKLLDRGHKLAKQAGVQILPWLSLKAWVDIGVSKDRIELIKKMYGVDMTPGINPDGTPGRTKPYDPAVIEAGYQYCSDYIDRYARDGALLHVMWEGKLRPVVALSVELEWSGSSDPLTQQMFRLWARAKYGNQISKLNKAWKTSFTGFEQIDMDDKSTFDLAAYNDGKSKHPNAAEDHVEFRSQVTDISLGEIKRRLLQKYPDLLIASELPYQIDAAHPHAKGYRIFAGANPSASQHAEILMLRATDTLSAAEEKAILNHKKRTGQKIILAYRTYSFWGPSILDGTSSYAKMNSQYAEQAARVADGLGFYSWNEMVDTHIVTDPIPSFHENSKITPKEHAATMEALRHMANAFTKAVKEK
ncbi:MAG: beta-galactosidase [Armatimonadota bacterium]